MRCSLGGHAGSCSFRANSLNPYLFAYPCLSVDCDALAECNWVGIRTDFVGDGVCDHFTSGGNNCYNHKICNYDGGDCCEDKCEDGDASWAECGSNGFYCADPESTNCDPEFVTEEGGCPNTVTIAPTPTPACSHSESLYKIVQYDSWGDGWDKAEMTVKNDATETVIYTGSLEDGAEGTIKRCFTDGCYRVELTAGDWGNEISWEVRPASGGSLLASGGAPMSCTFPVGGNQCENTCDGTNPAPAPIDPEPEPSPDDEQQNQLRCIADHCSIQSAACVADTTGCGLCIAGSDSPWLSFCSTNAKFSALTKCEQCYCVEGMEDSCDGQSGGNTCSGMEIIGGGQAVALWQDCTDIGGANNLFEEWDENNFGKLDDFEACAHAYHDDASTHGGHKASDCMQILLDTAKSDIKDMPNAIAAELYTNPSGMCDCSSDAWTSLPNCDTFSNYKTLIHETLDACTSLDWIDCDAWAEFSTTCEVTMKQVFNNNIDFFKTKQCNFLEQGCGGAGPFPSFRRLDCGGDIPKKNWDFWNSYSTGCAIAEDHDGDKPSPPTPTPPTPTPPSPTPVDPSKSGGDDKKEKGSAAGAVIGVLAALGFVVGGAVFYKRRRDSGALSSAYRYRPQRDSSMDGAELFSGMSVNSGSFKPPRIPPMTHNI